MGLNAEFPAEIAVEIPDNYIKLTGKKIFWVEDSKTNLASHNKPIIRPRGIHIDSKRSDATANYATIRGILHSEGPADWKTRTLAVGVVHPRGYRAIDVEGSDATGIEIIG